MSANQGSSPDLEARPQSPRLMAAIAAAQEETEKYRASLQPAVPPGPERDRMVDELMEWLDSDSLDWEAVELAHKSR